MELDAVGEEGRALVADIEVENKKSRANFDMAFFHMMQLLIRKVHSGVKKINMTPCTVIILTPHDIFGNKNPIERFCWTSQSGIVINKYVIVYMNLKPDGDGKKQMTSEQIDLAHDMMCLDPDQMRIDIIRETASQVKHKR